MVQELGVKMFVFLIILSGRERVLMYVYVYIKKIEKVNAVNVNNW